MKSPKTYGQFIRFWKRLNPRQREQFAGAYMDKRMRQLEFDTKAKATEIGPAGLATVKAGMEAIQ